MESTYIPPLRFPLFVRLSSFAPSAVTFSLRFSSVRLSALLCRLRLSSPPILSKLSALPVGSANVPRLASKTNGGEVLSVSNNPNHQVDIGN
jgi:hypothetical protein